jgi:hypothetical protein
MDGLLKGVKEGLCTLISDRHVVLLDGQPSVIPPRDQAAIVSSVPDIRIDTGRPAFRGRPARLGVQGGSGALTLLARTRPMPETSENDLLLVQWGADRRGRRVPICHVDGRTRTIHVLVDLHGASVADCRPGIKPAAVLVDVLFGEAMRALLDSGSGYSVGDEVGRHVRSLLNHRLEAGQEVFRNELRMLSRLATTSDALLPSALRRRIEPLRRALLEPRQKPTENERVTAGDVDREITRLGRLVTSRACALLRFSPSEIEGVLNPRVSGRYRIKPLMFRLESARLKGRPVLRVWDAAKAEVALKHPLCLGDGDPVLRKMEYSGDIYGMVDTVINFVDTNFFGMIQLDGARRPRSLCDVLPSVF